jgi:hypothetical protein
MLCICSRDYDGKDYAVVRQAHRETQHFDSHPVTESSKTRSTSLVILHRHVGTQHQIDAAAWHIPQVAKVHMCRFTCCLKTASSLRFHGRRAHPEQQCLLGLRLKLCVRQASGQTRRDGWASFGMMLLDMTEVRTSRLTFGVCIDRKKQLLSDASQQLADIQIDIWWVSFIASFRAMPE